jgi:protein TonB
MSAHYSGLSRALAVSLVLHAAALWNAGLLIPAPRPADRAPLSVWLREEPSPPPAVSQPALPRVIPAEKPKPVVEKKNRVPAEKPAPPPASTSAHLSGEAARVAQSQLARELLYPLEAVERGLEGQATVMLFLDDSGNVIASRLESSSGHAILDDAAVRAARSLRALPPSAPREALLPVRFRLR